MRGKTRNRYRLLWGIFLIALAAGGFSLLLKQESYASWIEDGDKKQFEKEDGELAKGFMEIEGERYYFDEDGYLVTGKFFCKEDQQYYYADKYGRIQTGIIKTKKGFFIADEEGRIQTGFVEYENNRYFFDGSATKITGWFKSEDNWYYADEEGIIQTGFLSLDGYRYYLNPDGTRVSDMITEIDGVTYVFNHDGSIDENATAMYPVYAYMLEKRNQIGNSIGLLMDAKVQACAVLRAADLKNGYALTPDTRDSLEVLLKNRGVKCDGGYEFSYGGVENYGQEQLISDMEKDIALQAVLEDGTVKEVGLGMYEQDGMFYFDFIFICNGT